MDRLLQAWPGSIIDTTMLVESVGRFLRTHRDGERLLYGFLDSAPVDRSEEEYERECQEERERHEAAILANLERYNAARRAQGLGPVDRHLNIISGPGARRNRKQTALARADQQEIERLLGRKPRLTAKEVVRILGWPSQKERAVRRHMAAMRARKG